MRSLQTLINQLGHHQEARREAFNSKICFLCLFQLEIWGVEKMQHHIHQKRHCFKSQVFSKKLFRWKGDFVGAHLGDLISKNYNQILSKSIFGQKIDVSDIVRKRFFMSSEMLNWSTKKYSEFSYPKAKPFFATITK